MKVSISAVAAHNLTHKPQSFLPYSCTDIAGITFRTGLVGHTHGTSSLRLRLKECCQQQFKERRTKILHRMHGNLGRLVSLPGLRPSPHRVQLVMSLHGRSALFYPPFRPSTKCSDAIW
ncbi:unnamed protein product [Ectocarpus sp. 12 AP-2014]